MKYLLEQLVVQINYYYHYQQINILIILDKGLRFMLLDKKFNISPDTVKVFTENKQGM